MVKLDMLVFIGLMLVLITSCRNKQEMVMSVETAQELVVSLSAAIEADGMRFEKHYRELKYILGDLSKLKYTPVMSVIDTIKLQKKELNNFLEQLDIKINDNKPISNQEKIAILSELDVFKNVGLLIDRIVSLRLGCR